MSEGQRRGERPRDENGGPVRRGAAPVLPDVPRNGSNGTAGKTGAGGGGDVASGLPRWLALLFAALFGALMVAVPAGFRICQLRREARRRELR